MLLVCIELKDYQQAKTCINEAFFLSNKHFSQSECTDYVLLYQGYAACMEKMFKESKAKIEKYLESPRDPHKANAIIAKLCLADILINEKQYQNSFLVILEIIQSVPTFFDLSCLAYEKIIELLFLEKKYKEAYEYTTKCCELMQKNCSPEDWRLPKIFLYLSCSQRAKKMKLESKASLEQAVKIILIPGFSDIKMKTMITFEMGNAYLREKNYKKAKEFYENAKNSPLKDNFILQHKIETNFASAERLMNHIEKAKQLYKNTIFAIKEKLKHNPCIAKSLINLGTIYAEMGNKRKSIDSLNLANNILIDNKMGDLPLYKKLISFMNRVNRMKDEQDYYGLKQEQMMMPILPRQTTEEEEGIRDTILGIIRYQSNKVNVEKCFKEIANLLSAGIEENANPIKIDTKSENYKKTVGLIEDAGFVFNLLNFEPEGDFLVRKNPDYELLKSVVNFLQHQDYYFSIAGV